MLNSKIINILIALCLTFAAILGSMALDEYLKLRFHENVKLHIPTSSKR